MLSLDLHTRYGAAMARVYELMVQGTGSVAHAVPVGTTPLSIGRGNTNDLVCDDGMVSWEHMKVWADHEKIWLSDVGSTNGTFVNGEPIKGTVVLQPGDIITAGSLELVVHIQAELERARAPSTIAVEEVQSGLKRPMQAGRFVIGSAKDADLRIPDAAPYVAEFAVHGPDDCMLVMGHDDYPLELGEEVEIAGLRLRLVEVEAQRDKTLKPVVDRFPYRVEASLDGPTGPYAMLTHLRTGNQCRVEAETRAILLYLLAQRIVSDREAEQPPIEIGWVPDDEVIVGVWGKSGLPDGANRLKVLVHRLRAELKKSEFDPWVIERRRRYIRIRTRQAQIHAG